MTKIDSKIVKFSTLTKHIKQLDLSHESAEYDNLSYSDEIINTLDERYTDYKNGIELVSQGESHRKIYKLFASI
jgi:hypothetical protein